MTKTRTPKKLLVLGRDDRAFLAVVRSLGRAGHAVHVAWHDPGSLALTSRYVARAHELPRSELADGSWVSALEALCRTERFDALVPTSDPSLFAVLEQRARLEPWAAIVAPNPRCLEIAFDKLLTWEWALRAGLRVPEQSRVRRIEEAEAAGALAQAWGWPLVLKPRHSFAFGRDKWEQQARKARSPEELRSYLAIMLDKDEVLVQRNIPGTGLGVDVLAQAGRVLRWFQHRRLHEPPDGGPSSLRVSEQPCPELQAQVARLAAELELTGVAMFEFKAPARPRKGKADPPVFLEVNARPWGSLPLALACGADFPAEWIELAVCHRTPVLPPARLGLRARNWTLDVSWLRDCRRVSPASFVQGGTLRPSAGLLLGELVRALDFSERSDLLVADDPRPGLIEAARLGRTALGVVRSRAARALARLDPSANARARGLRGRIARAASVLFVCKGNLCRSPFAANAARRLWPQTIEVASAGTHARAGTAPPRAAIEHARALGIDLGEHRAAELTSAAVERADWVLVFDAANMTAVRARFPWARSKLRPLARVLGRGPSAVADPFGGSFGDYRRCFEHVWSCLAAVAEELPQVESSPSKAPLRTALPR